MRTRPRKPSAEQLKSASTQSSSDSQAGASAHPGERLLDLRSAAESILSQTLTACAQSMDQTHIPTLVDRLRQGDRATMSHYRHNLARELAQHLSRCDNDLKAVYLYDQETVETELAQDEDALTRLVHLIVWAQPKTAALNSLIAALNADLSLGFGDLIGARLPAHLLDVQVIDDAEVKYHIGYASLLFSPRYAPVQVWKRAPGAPSKGTLEPA